MKLILLIILVALILILLLFLIRLRIEVMFNSDRPDINITLPRLSHFFNIVISIENSNLMLTLFLFNKKIIKKRLKKGNGNHNSMEIVQLTNPKDINVNIQYGFSDPFSTGIACGAINIASQFINIDSINQTPDFTANSDYIYLDATAKVNVGSALVKLSRLRSNS